MKNKIKKNKFFSKIRSIKIVVEKTQESTGSQ